MKNEDWLKTLDEGKYYEELAIKKHLEYDDYTIETMCSSYDIEIIKDNIKEYYEVKSDKITQLTGNIFIEYESNKKPSGISITTADYYLIFEVVYKDQYNLYKIPINSLKELCNTSKIKKNSGYKGYSSGYLVKKERCKEFLIFSNIIKLCLV
jgi:hypothetical protein